MAEGLTKKQFKELRKLEKMQSKSLEKKNDTVKWIAITAVCAIFLLIFVGIIVVAKNKNKPQTANGNAQFANNGHARMLTKDGKDASVSANPSQKTVTMIEYGDIQCPACKAYYPLVKEVMAAYPQQLKLIFKNFPLTTVHPNAMEAAIAAEAAGKQGKYFQMVDILYERQDEWAGLDNPESKFEEYVKELGMNVAQFQKDQKDPGIQKLISDEQNEGIQNGVTGTPTFFVDGQKIDNPPDIDSFKKIIGDALKTSTGNSIPAVSPTTAPDTLPLQP
jgi:protein-disulfide isomerase